MSSPHSLQSDINIWLKIYGQKVKEAVCVLWGEEFSLLDIKIYKAIVIGWIDKQIANGKKGAQKVHTYMERSFMTD